MASTAVAAAATQKAGEDEDRWDSRREALAVAACRPEALAVAAAAATAAAPVGMWAARKPEAVQSVRKEAAATTLTAKSSFSRLDTAALRVCDHACEVCGKACDPGVWPGV